MAWDDTVYDFRNFDHVEKWPEVPVFKKILYSSQNILENLITGCYQIKIILGESKFQRPERENNVSTFGLLRCSLERCAFKKR